MFDWVEVVSIMLLCFIIQHGKIYANINILLQFDCLHIDIQTVTIIIWIKTQLEKKLRLKMSIGMMTVCNDFVYSLDS